MSNLTEYNSKQFNKNLVNIKSADSTMKGRVQTTIEMAIHYYKDKGNKPVMLVKAMDTVQGCKSIASKKVQIYIQDALGLSYRKIKNKKGEYEYTFKKVKAADESVLNVTWYGYSKEGEAKPDMDVIAQAKSFLTRITNNLDAGTCKQSQAELSGLVASLRTFTA